MLPTGVILIGGTGEIVHMNRTASVSVAENDGLRATRDGLRAERHGESALLTKLVLDAVSKSNGDGLSVGGTVLLSRHARPPLQVLISPIRTPIMSTSQPIAAIVFVVDPSQRQRPAQDVLRTLFGLTPAECRVALLLADGHAPREISQMVGVSFNTVRSQMKSIFVKTDVKRQGELIRLLLSSPGFGFKTASIS